MQKNGLRDYDTLKHCVPRVYINQKGRYNMSATIGLQY